MSLPVGALRRVAAVAALLDRMVSMDVQSPGTGLVEDAGPFEVVSSMPCQAIATLLQTLPKGLCSSLAAFNNTPLNL